MEGCWYEVGEYYGPNFLKYRTLGQFNTPLEAIRACRRLYRKTCKDGSWGRNLTACRRGGGAICDMDWYGSCIDRTAFVGQDGRGW